MAYADYEHCDTCDAKVIYTGDVDVPDGAIVFCPDCGPKVQATLAALSGLTEPRTWSLPAEPGPEVTAVRDRAGSRWIRATVEPFHEGWYLEDLEGAPHEWAVVLNLGPLTDATGETP